MQPIIFQSFFVCECLSMVSYEIDILEFLRLQIQIKNVDDDISEH